MKIGYATTIGNFDGLHLGHAALIAKIKRNAKEMNLKTAIETYIKFKLSKNKSLKPNSQKLTLYHLNKFNKTISKRYGSGIMIKHVDIKILAWYYALRNKELRISSMEVHRRIIDSFLEWTKN